MTYLIIYTVCLGVALFGVLCDCVSSLNFEAYGIKEKTKMWRDARGYFSEKKYLAAHFALIGIITFIASLIRGVYPSAVAGCGVVLLAIGILRFADALRNWGLKRKRRGK